MDNSVRKTSLKANWSNSLLKSRAHLRAKARSSIKVS